MASSRRAKQTTRPVAIVARVSKGKATAIAMLSAKAILFVERTTVHGEVLGTTV